MRKTFAACAAAFVTLVLGGCDVLTVLHGFPEPRVVTKGSLPIELSYREGKGGLVILSGRVNGKVDVDFVLDTGAPVTVLIDSERTAALGIDTSNPRRLGPSGDPAVPIGVIRGGLLHDPGAWKLPPGAVEVPLAFDRGHPFVDTKVTLPTAGSQRYRCISTAA